MTLFLTVFLVSYIWHALGITVGYHRLIAHRSFSCPKAVEYFWVFAGYLAFEGSPIWWSTIHRAHHRDTDGPLDPHSPKKGWGTSYYGWLTRGSYEKHIDPVTQAPDLVKDPLYRFLEQNGDWHRAHLIAFASCILFRVVIFLCFGWVAALASLVAGLVVLQIPLMVNLFCHIPRLGYKTYATSDKSVNVWWLGWLAMGEGWHNNHHASPGAANTGMLQHEFDLTWLVIRVMKRLGLVTWVNVATHAQLTRRCSAVVLAPQSGPIRHRRNRRLAHLKQ